jgi:hypothetical protein
MVYQRTRLIHSFQSQPFGLTGHSSLAITTISAQCPRQRIWMEAAKSRKRFLANGKVQTPHEQRIDLTWLISKIEQAQVATPSCAIGALGPEAFEPARWPARVVRQITSAYKVYFGIVESVHNGFEPTRSHCDVIIDEYEILETCMKRPRMSSMVETNAWFEEILYGDVCILDAR